MRGWADYFAVQDPGRQLHVGRYEPEEVLLPLLSLNGDMDVVMAIGEVGSGTTVTTWQLRAFDLNEHDGIVARLKRSASVALQPGRVPLLSTRTPSFERLTRAGLRARHLTSLRRNRSQMTPRSDKHPAFSRHRTSDT
jgi:hypothetical protein